MKTILLFLFLPFIFLFSQTQKLFYIEKNNQGGYNIFSPDKELLYEYTSRNTDSLSLSTLDYIYFEAQADDKNLLR